MKTENKKVEKEKKQEIKPEFRILEVTKVFLWSPITQKYKYLGVRFATKSESTLET